MHSVISFNLSEWANTFEANITSAFFFILFKFFLSKKQLIVLILFLLANFAKFFAGSTPKIFLKPKFLNGLRATPSLLPISMIYDFLGDNFNSFIYLVAASWKCFLKETDVEERYK